MSLKITLAKVLKIDFHNYRSKRAYKIAKSMPKSFGRQLDKVGYERIETGTRKILAIQVKVQYLSDKQGWI